MADSVEHLQAFLDSLGGNLPPFTDPDKWRDKHRTHVAVSLGYFPAKRMAFLYDTYGLAIADQLPKIRAAGLRPDWGGLRCELIYSCGMKPSHADSLIEEAHYFDRFIANG